MNHSKLVRTNFSGCDLIGTAPHPYGIGILKYFDLQDDDYFGVVSVTGGAQVFHKDFSHYSVTEYLLRFLETCETFIITELPRRKPPIRRASKTESQKGTKIKVPTKRRVSTLSTPKRKEITKRKTFKRRIIRR